MHASQARTRDQQPWACTRCLPLLVALVVVCLATAQPPPDPSDSLVFGDDPRKPVEVDDALLCHACNAVLLEVTNQVHAKVGASKWSVPEAFAAMERICHHTRFRKYEYIPPTMVKGCHRFMDLHSEELEELLEKGSKVPLSSMQAALCHTYCSAAGVVFEDPEAAAARRQAEAQAEEQGRVKQEGAGKKKKKRSKAKAEAKQTASGMGGEGAGSGAAKEEL